MRGVLVEVDVLLFRRGFLGAGVEIVAGGMKGAGRAMFRPERVMVSWGLYSSESSRMEISESEALLSALLSSPLERLRFLLAWSATGVVIVDGIGAGDCTVDCSDKGWAI